jgi:2-methylisocitrate lyase-like PEP mutase family enzyme
VQTFERRGASALQLEDQVTPKRCGHLRDKALIPAAEMAGKIKAALDARESSETVLIARTDAVAVEGFEAALDRADAYAEAGADVIFVEAPRDRAQLAAIAQRFTGRRPVMANMVEGGSTPILSAAELQAFGFQLVIFPGGTVRALAFALQDYFANLKAHGTTTPFKDRMLDFKGINRLIATDEFLARGKTYDPAGAP